MKLTTFTWAEILERHPDFPEGEDEQLLYLACAGNSAAHATTRLMAGIAYSMGCNRAHQEELDDRGG